MTWSSPLLIFAVSAGITWLATRQLIPILRQRGIMDVPNPRSSHASPTPRGGGLAVLSGLAAGWVLSRLLGGVAPDACLPLALGLVALVGLWDDVRGGVSRILRLSLQLAAAGIVVWCWEPLTVLPLPEPLSFSLGFWGVPISMLWLVGVTNIVNFLDGIDGFATGQALLAGSGLAVLGALRSDPWMLTLGSALAGACLGFLPFNWHPARVFLGDVGSSVIGFGLAAAALSPGGMPSEDGVFATALLLWFFLADGTTTLARRALRGRPVWRAHRQHLYQRLVRSGLRHSQVTVCILGLALIPATLGVLSVATASTAGQWISLAVAAVAFGTLWISVERRERRINDAEG